MGFISSLSSLLTFLASFQVSLVTKTTRFKYFENWREMKCFEKNTSINLRRNRANRTFEEKRNYKLNVLCILQSNNKLLSVYTKSIVYDLERVCRVRVHRNV